MPVEVYKTKPKGNNQTFTAAQVQRVVYYSTTGQVSSEPFAGMNIKVTTYNDGHKTVQKLIVK